MLDLSYAYDTQGRQVWTEDQAGNVIETTFDDAGRETARAVTTLASGFDGAVRRIGTSYTSLGQRELVTQYDAATAGSVVDEVKYEYERFGGLQAFRQDMNGAVDAFGSVDDYAVSYTWEQSTGERTSWRKATTTMPSGNVLTFSYGSGLDDEISRLRFVKEGATRLVGYDYLGYTQVVGQGYDIPDLSQEYYGSTSGSYPGLDRFGRVVQSNWERELGGGDIDLYDVTLGYDRNSNIVLAEDAIIPGRDVEYTMDGLDRLTRAQAGSWSGSAISSETIDEDWTLDHLGNWTAHQLDLDADDAYDSGTDELDETRTHNAVNELLTRDLDNDLTDDETLSYNAVGELTDDGASWEYVYDAFGRLRKVNADGGALVAEFRYNGLGFQIAQHTDLLSPSGVDGADPWYFNAFDERWRKLATFRATDTDPKEEFVPHQAGLDGSGGSSYINDIALRDKDRNTPWTTASDGALEQRTFYLNNWRGDVVGLVTSTGYQAESVRYSPYGTPFGYPGGDCDADGAADSADATVISGWISGSTYDVRGDLDLDGDVDSTDSTLFAAAYSGTTTGRGVLSSGGNQVGYAGMLWFGNGQYLARRRSVISETGRWLSRDPEGYGDSFNLAAYAKSNPFMLVDPWGLRSCASGDCGPADFDPLPGMPVSHGPLFGIKYCAAEITSFVLGASDSFLTLSRTSCEPGYCLDDEKPPIYKDGTRGCKCWATVQFDSTVLAGSDWDLIVYEGVKNLWNNEPTKKPWEGEHVWFNGVTSGNMAHNVLFFVGCSWWHTDFFVFKSKDGSKVITTGIIIKCGNCGSQPPESIK